MPIKTDRTREVYAALVHTDLSDLQLAAQLGLSATWVRKVRLGKLFKYLYPELPRALPGASKRRLKRFEQIVTDLLEHGLPEAEVAEKWNLHITTARRIAVGDMYKNIRPDLPRRPVYGPSQRRQARRELIDREPPVKRKATCLQCRLFNTDPTPLDILASETKAHKMSEGICSLGFPDARNISAASRCPAFWDKNEVACYDAAAA